MIDRGVGCKVSCSLSTLMNGNVLTELRFFSRITKIKKDLLYIYDGGNYWQSPYLP